MCIRVPLRVVPIDVGVWAADPEGECVRASRGGAAAHDNPSRRTRNEQQDGASTGRGLGLQPPVLIFGYYLCAPPGKPSVLDIVTGQTSAPSIELRVFNQDGSFAGIESLLRADLHRGQPCPQDNLAEWGLLDLPVDYRACHHFGT